MKSQINFMVRGLCALTTVTLSTWATAAPGWVQWSSSVGGNDHWYKFVDTGRNVSWSEANNFASQSDAYLATPTSKAENDFVYSLIVSWSPVSVYPLGWGGPWLGGFAPDNRPYPTYGWQWITGEAWSFTDWNSTRFNVEPNNAGGHENYLMMVNLNDGLSQNSVGTWNDLGVAGTGIYFTTSYMMERNTAPVPEPATLSLLGLGALGLFKRRATRSTL